MTNLRTKITECRAAGDDETAELFEELERLREATAWRPIETAPKDETKIFVARYDETFGWVLGTSEWVKEFGGHWLSRGVGGVADGLGLSHPTHWMPLPQPMENEDG